MKKLPFAAMEASATVVDFRGTYKRATLARTNSMILPCNETVALPPTACTDQLSLQTLMEDLVVDGLLQFEPLQQGSHRSTRLCNKHTNVLLSKLLSHTSSDGQAMHQQHSSSGLADAAFTACSSATASSSTSCCTLDHHVVIRPQVSCSTPCNPGLGPLGDALSCLQST